MPKTNKFPPKKTDNSHLVKHNVKQNWSEFQKNIFRNIAKEDGHLIIEALAGSGKTTSLIESFKYVPKGKNIIALAFNKSIQTELQSRSPSYVMAKTYHSIGLMAIKQRFNNVEIDDYKINNIIRNIDKFDSELIDSLKDTVAHCKNSLIDHPTGIENIINKFNIDLCEMELKEFTSLIIKILRIDKESISIIDFADMCWFPFVYNLPLPKFKIVFCDEFQDLNKSQFHITKKLCAPDGRIIILGDMYQDLYSWRDSDAQSFLNEIKSISNTKILTLPISYRCPKKVIELAQNWVPNITCPETAIDGEIENISLNQLYKIAKPGCFILSRTNAPLIKICMFFIRNNIKANIRGRDVGKQLNFIIKKSKKKQIPAFLKWLEVWKNEELSKLQEKGINTDNLLDRYECLTNLCDECNSLSEVSDKIDELFNDVSENNVIILSTVHRAKGLERDDVFLLKWTFRAWFDNMDILDKPNEECNIVYVAATRCKKRLFIVNKNIC